MRNFIGVLSVIAVSFLTSELVLIAINSSLSGVISNLTKGVYLDSLVTGTIFYSLVCSIPIAPLYLFARSKSKTWLFVALSAPIAIIAMLRFELFVISRESLDALRIGNCSFLRDGSLTECGAKYDRNFVISLISGWAVASALAMIINRGVQNDG